MPDEKYCTCCGEDVPTNTIMRDGNAELTCMYCGFVLEVARPGGRPASPPAPPPPPRPALDYVLAADDSHVARDLIKRLLLQKPIAKEVVTLPDGQELVGALTRRLTDQQPIALVILDLEMPTMDGLTAARVVRTVEAKFGVPKVPILFFSGRKCDDALKQQLELFAPAGYMNKVADGDPERLAERMAGVVGTLRDVAARAQPTSASGR